MTHFWKKTKNYFGWLVGHGEDPYHFMRYERQTAVAMERKLVDYYGIPGQDARTVANLLKSTDSVHYFDTSENQRWRFYVVDGQLLGAQIAPAYDDVESFPYGLDPLVEMGAKPPPTNGSDSIGLFQQINPSDWSKMPFSDPDSPHGVWKTAGPEVDTAIMWNDIVLPLVPEPTQDQLDEWDAMLQNMGIDPSIMNTYDYQRHNENMFIDSLNKVAGELADTLNKQLVANFAANGEVFFDMDTGESGIPVYTAPWVPEDTVMFVPHDTLDDLPKLPYHMQADAIPFTGIAKAYRDLDKAIAGSETADAEEPLDYTELNKVIARTKAWSEIDAVVDTYYEGLNPKYVGKTVLVNHDPIAAKNGVYKMELPKPRRVSKDIETPEQKNAAAMMRSYWDDFPDAKYDLPRPNSFVKMKTPMDTEEVNKRLQEDADKAQKMADDLDAELQRKVEERRKTHPEEFETVNASIVRMSQEARAAAAQNHVCGELYCTCEPGKPLEGTDMVRENPRTDAQIIRDIQGSEKKTPKHAARGKAPRPGETRVRIDSAGNNHILDRG